MATNQIDKITIESVVEKLKAEMEKCKLSKLTGQVQLELNYSCGGLSKVYLINKVAVK